jgi:plastocyanin
MRAKTIASLILLFLGSMMLQACGSDGDGGGKATPASGAKPANGATVEAYDFRFEPKTLTAKVGDAVTLTFKNEGSAEHNFSLSPPGADQAVDQDVEKGETVEVSFTPDEAGRIEFFCKYHKGRGMVGSLDVST